MCTHPPPHLLCSTCTPGTGPPRNSGLPLKTDMRSVTVGGGGGGPAAAAAVAAVLPMLLLLPTLLPLPLASLLLLNSSLDDGSPATVDVAVANAPDGVTAAAAAAP